MELQASEPSANGSSLSLESQEASQLLEDIAKDISPTPEIPRRKICVRNVGGTGMDDKLSTSSLVEMTPIFQGSDIVKLASRHLFLSKLKSQQAVCTFFPNHSPSRNEASVRNDWFDFETFSVLYVCQAISKCRDPYALHTLINEESVDQHMHDIVICPEWKKIGFALYTTLFPDLVKDQESGVPFRAYIENNRYHWGRILFETICDSRWQFKFLQPDSQALHSSCDYKQRINMLLVKLHLLDPTLVMPAFQNMQKAFPELNLELATKNYLGDALDWTLIRNEVEDVIYRPLYPRNMSRFNFSPVDVYYGVEILEFVMMEPRDLNLITDKLPDNHRTLSFRDRCSIM